MSDPSEQSRQMEELIQKIQEQSEASRDVGMAVLKAAIRSRDSTKQWIEGETEAKRLESEAYIFFEYVYFYLHLAMRSAFVALTEYQMGNLQEYLGILVPAAAVESYFAHWPEELLRGMKREFVDNLNEAELEYTQAVRDSTLEVSTDKFLGIFLLLAIRITQWCTGKDQEREPNLLVIDIAMNDWKEMRLGALMDRVSRTLEA